MKKLIATVLTVVFLLSAPAGAMDRVQFYYGLQPPSSWLNIQSRFARLGLGQFMLDAFGSTTGLYSNLSITSPSGLNVTVGPTLANSRGSIYQFLQDDTTPIGGALSFTAGLGAATAGSEGGASWTCGKAGAVATATGGTGATGPTVAGAGARWTTGAGAGSLTTST